MLAAPAAFPARPTLTVSSSGVPPGISTQPGPQSVLIGQNASFSVTATGDGPLSYQWWKDTASLTNDSVFSGVNTNVLTLTGAQTAHNGNYFVVITNAAGMTNSSSAAWAVSPPPGLTTSRVSGGVVLCATTIPGLTYVELTASNLTSPITWTPMLTNVVPPGGVVQLTNTTSDPRRFFRLSFP